MILSTHINTSKLANFFSNFNIFCLFLGFALYHTLLINKLIPNFLGGFFGFFTIIAAITMIPFIKNFFLKAGQSSPYLMLFNIIAFSFVAVITSISAFTNSFVDPAVLQSIQLIIYWITMILIGFFFIQAKKNKLILAFKLFSTLYLLYAIYYIFTEGRLMLTFGIDTGLDDNEASGYQGIARSFLIIAIITITYTKKRIISILWTVAFGFLLFVIGARSEFYAFIIAVIAYHGLMSLKYKVSFLTISVLLASLLFASIYFSDEISQSRQLQVLDLNQSSSWIARKDMQHFAMRQIQQSPIFGEFGGHVQYRSIGTYAHNALSGYVNYGLAFFALFTFMSLYIFVDSTKKLLKNTEDKDWFLSFLFNLIVLVLIITAKPVFWPVTYLAWGIYLGAKYQNKKSFT